MARRAAADAAASARSARRDLPTGQGGLLGEDDLDGVVRVQGVEEVGDQDAVGGLVLPGQDGDRAVRPCLIAFMRDRRFPSGPEALGSYARSGG